MLVRLAISMGDEKAASKYLEELSSCTQDSDYHSTGASKPKLQDIATMKPFVHFMMESEEILSGRAFLVAAMSKIFEEDSEDELERYERQQINRGSISTVAYESENSNAENSGEDSAEELERWEREQLNRGIGTRQIDRFKDEHKATSLYNREYASSIQSDEQCRDCFEQVDMEVEAVDHSFLEPVARKPGQTHSVRPYSKQYCPRQTIDDVFDGRSTRNVGVKVTLRADKTVTISLIAPRIASLKQYINRHCITSNVLLAGCFGIAGLEALDLKIKEMDLTAPLAAAFLDPLVKGHFKRSKNCFLLGTYKINVFEDELLRYSTTPSLNIDPLKFWKTNEEAYPILAKVAKEILCIPASSAPSERAFSLCN
uniref:HAT C-terminal dimerisation domain-containing protein n=1 Tax=Ditylenchus dipsaci TaxID=166011 RepID=A0A915D5A2_9BILA